MPSCSNSSNIQTNVNVLNVASAGARLITTIDKTPSSGAYTVESGITAGDVIRYDVTPATPVYRPARANNIENADGSGNYTSNSDFGNRSKIEIISRTDLLTARGYRV